MAPVVHFFTGMVFIRLANSFRLPTTPRCHRHISRVAETPFTESITSSSMTVSRFPFRLARSHHAHKDMRLFSPTKEVTLRSFTSLSSTISGSNTDESVATSTASDGTNGEKKKRKKKKRRSKEKNREFIGMAKAVDRGVFNVYRPIGDDGTFSAKSGLPDRTKPFTVLGIESSCDDTGAAVVRSDGVILGESLASQNEIHEEFGGIVPNLARNAHEEKIDEVIADCLEKANMSIDEVDAIGVTVGPGLEICLRVGCNKARQLAIENNKPFVGVHHLEAHILMARLPEHDESGAIGGVLAPATDDTHELARAMDFPFLALLVSGGHCQLLKCLGIGNYTIIGGTIDDSLGEAYDKTARMLGLPVGGGGGPAVEKLARGGDPKALPLPIPMQNRKDFDFSYSGLKTSVLRAANNLKKERGLSPEDELSHEDKMNVAASFQHVAIRHIEQRLERTMTLLEKEGEGGIRSLAVVGGVAANTELRSRLKAVCEKRKEPWSMFVPPPRLCTDQGSMSAWAAIERIMVGSTDEPAGHEVHARYPFSNEN